MTDKRFFQLPFITFLKAAFVGGLSLLFFYFAILLVITGDINHPFNQFSQLQPWMSILIVGFGIQVGIFWLLRRGHQLGVQNRKDSNVATGSGAAFSGLSMIACCAHHLADVIPILGISGATLFLTQYQKEFIMLGIVANVLGIIYMLWLLLGKAKPTVIWGYLLSSRK